MSNSNKPNNPAKSDNTAAIDQSLENEINEVNLTTSEKLSLETAIMLWHELEMFFAKGNLLQVEAGCDLTQVGAAIADNNTAIIDDLINNEQLAFATVDWVRTHCQADTKLWTLVVAPYVVCQLAKDK